ncbi:MAG: hypothetical protein HY537_07045 [Deltaproteobacteria bacterium]|nr:hypothetical protein [Deltaproteobacteria bacterium]
MRKIFYLITPFIITVLLTGCGAYSLFQRGEKVTKPTGPTVNKETLTAEQMFTQFVAPALEKSCKGCHANPAPTYEAAKTKITGKNPDESALYFMAKGESHPGGKIWAEGSTQLSDLHDWIMKEEAPLPPPPPPPGPEEQFVNTVAPHLKKSCKGCHPNRDKYSDAKNWISGGKPEESHLYLKAQGLEGHAGGAIWTVDSEQLKAMREWILAEPSTGPSVVLDKAYFDTNVSPVLNNNIMDNDFAGCIGCHSRNGGPTSFDFESAKGMVIAGNPDASPLYQKAAGTGSGHSYKWADSTLDSQVEKKLEFLKNWILGAK